MTVRAQAQIMGMPIELCVADGDASDADSEAVFDYLRGVDNRFSPFKDHSETQAICRGDLQVSRSSPEMQGVLDICEQTRVESGGYFDAFRLGGFDPSGVVKGYAIENAANLLRQVGYRNFFIEAGGDIQTGGLNEDGEKWHIGLRSPFAPELLLAVVHLSGEGIATSATYYRGDHILDPISGLDANAVASVTVISASVADADRYATAAYAMGENGIGFVEQMPGLEGLVINWDRTAVCTSGFPAYLSP